MQREDFSQWKTTTCLRRSTSFASTDLLTDVARRSADTLSVCPLSLCSAMSSTYFDHPLQLEAWHHLPTAAYSPKYSVTRGALLLAPQCCDAASSEHASEEFTQWAWVGAALTVLGEYLRVCTQSIAC